MITKQTAYIPQLALMGFQGVLTPFCGLFDIPSLFWFCADRGQLRRIAKEKKFGGEMKVFVQNQIKPFVKLICAIYHTMQLIG